MSKQYWPTGPAESLRTRELAEAEWARLVSSAVRDKNSFLTELQDINNRIIGLKQALPPLNIPQTVSYQEKPKDYGFVVDSNMRVASASSLSNAKVLRENLSRMLSQQEPPSSAYKSTEPGLTRKETKRTDFDILSYTMQAESQIRNSNADQRHEPHLRPIDGYFVPSVDHRSADEDARREAEFARALEAYRSSRPAALEEPASAPSQQGEAVSLLKEEPVDGTTGFCAREEEGSEGEGEEAGSDDEGHDEDANEEEEDEDVQVSAEDENQEEAAVVPAVPVSAAPKEYVPSAPASTTSPSFTTICDPPAHSADPPAPPASNVTLSSKSQVQPPVSSAAPAPAPAEPGFEKPRGVPNAPAPPSEGSDQLSRLQAWEKELQEREQKVLQYMNSLSRPMGAKMPPKPLHDDSEAEQDDAFEQRYGGRRRDDPLSALRGSADIHIHNHIAPPITMPAFSPQQSVVAPRSSLYDAYQRSTFTPSKYEYTPSVGAQAQAPREYSTPSEVRPSIQTRYPQRSEIRSNYAFPPAPYSSLNSGAANVDLSGLSLERMRELTGHY